MNIIDVVSIVPFYLEQILSAAMSGNQPNLGVFVMLRALRLTRVFRAFKLGKHSFVINLLVEALKDSTDALSLLIFLLGIATILFSSAMYLAEQTGAKFDDVSRQWIYEDGSVR